MLTGIPDVGRGGLPPVRAALGPILPGARILFAGDSVTKGYNASIPADDPTFRWSAPLEATLTAEFTAAGKTVPTYINTAVSGQTAAAMASDVTAQIVTPAADHIFLQIGQNDTFTSATQAATTAALTTIYNAAIAANPSVKIHQLSLFFWGEKWPQGQNAAGQDAALDLRNSTILNLVNTYPAANIEWIWLRQLLMLQESQINLPSPGAASGFLTQDGTHLTKTAVSGGATYVSSLVRSRITLAT